MSISIIPCRPAMYDLPHGWKLFNEGFDYEKEPYEVMLPNGTITEAYPNAGMLHELHPAGRIFHPSDNVRVRLLGWDAWHEKRKHVVRTKALSPAERMLSERKRLKRARRTGRR